MPRPTEQSQSTIIVGGGVAGLSIAAELARSNHSVTLFERSELGAGATGRNQGWLHSGALFAREDPDLARMCYESLQRTRRECPQCIEPRHQGMAYLVSRVDTEIESWTSAWEKAGILYADLPLEEIQLSLPDIDASLIRSAFLLPDCSMSVPSLMQHLATDAANAGATIQLSTPVTGLRLDDHRVTGVQVGEGDVVEAELVILAGGASGQALRSQFPRSIAGRSSQESVVTLIGHLISVSPGVGNLPFCVVDAEEFNHLPHSNESIFGTGHWITAPGSTAPPSPRPEELERTWNRITEFFPKLDRAAFQNVQEWAGATVQAMQVDQVHPGRSMRPTVIDHRLDLPPLENLISVYPGRASLWPQVAEQTHALVSSQLS